MATAVVKRLVLQSRTASGTVVGKLSELVNEDWQVAFNKLNLSHEDKFLFVEVSDPNADEYQGVNIFLGKVASENIRKALKEGTDESDILCGLLELNVREAENGAYWFVTSTSNIGHQIADVKKAEKPITWKDLAGF